MLFEIGLFSFVSGVTLFLFREDSDKKKILSVLKANNIEVKSGKYIHKPRIVKSERQEWGMRYFLQLPRGISSDKVKNISQSLTEALNRDIEISFNYYTQIDVFDDKLPEQIDFEASLIDVNDYKVPLGRNLRREVIYLDLAGQFSHLIVGGISGSGKSTLTHLILTVLSLKKNKPELYISDLKYGIELQDFEHFEHVKGFATTIEDLEMMLDEVVKKMEERYRIMKENKEKLWKGVPIVLLIDEMIDIKLNKGADDKTTLEIKGNINKRLSEITAKGRAARVYAILATQRPDKEVISGIIKTNVANTIGYKTRDEVQSRIILDNHLSAELEYIPGRGYLQTSDDVLMQTFYLSEEKERELLKEVPKKVNQHEQTFDEDRQMESNPVDIRKVRLFINKSDREDIQTEKGEHSKDTE